MKEYITLTVDGKSVKIEKGSTLLEAASGDLTAGIATGTLAAGFAASFITGCLACKFMIEIVKRGKLIWFSLYCALAGLVSILSYFC